MLLNSSCVLATVVTSKHVTEYRSFVLSVTSTHLNTQPAVYFVSSQPETETDEASQASKKQLYL